MTALTLSLRRSLVKPTNPNENPRGVLMPVDDWLEAERLAILLSELTIMRALLRLAPHGVVDVVVSTEGGQLKPAKCQIIDVDYLSWVTHVLDGEDIAVPNDVRILVDRRTPGRRRRGRMSDHQRAEFARREQKTSGEA